MSLQFVPVIYNDSLTVADKINALSRRHLDIVFSEVAVKGAPAMSLASEPDASGKYKLTVTPRLTTELVRAYNSGTEGGSSMNVGEAQLYIKKNLGDVLVHTGDYLSKAAGVSSKGLYKILEAAEEARLSKNAAAKNSRNDTPTMA